MGRDVRYAIQALWRTRAFTISATITLGLAIGANAAIFGLVDGMWLRPAGIPRSSELTRVIAMTQQRANNRAGWSFSEYRELQDVAGFSGVIARGSRGAQLRQGSAPPELTLVNVVSTNFFSVLGVTPAYGRLFAPGDEAALDEQPGIVLGHAFWQRRFGGDPAIVGRTISLGRTGDVPVTVLGVLPRSFRDLDAAGDRDLWLPPATWVRLTNRAELERRDERWFSIFARRRDASVAVAQAEVNAIVAKMARDYPATSAGRSARVVSDDDFRLEAAGVSAYALLGLVLIVVLITCVNLANLILARTASRTQEIATRVALGATRWRVMRQMLAESIVLGALGSLAGITVALWLIRLLPAVLPQPPGFPSLLLFQVDGRVLTFTLGLSLVTTLLFGLVPSWIAARGDVIGLMKGSSVPPGSGTIDRLTRQALIVGQVAVSLVLLSAAAVLARSFISARSAEIGFQRKPILTAWSSAGEVQQPIAMEGVSRLESLPGVLRVAVAFRAPLSLSGGGLALGVWLPHLPPPPGEGLVQVKYNAVSANYFITLGLRLLRGRVFTDGDQRPGEPVVVVNQAFADRFYGGGDAVGRRIRLRRADGIEHRIVGVVDNGIVNAIDDKNEPYLYLPYWRGAYDDLTYLIEPVSGAGNLQTPVREALKSVHPSLAPHRLITMSEYLDYATSPHRTTATLTLALAFLGLVLTAVGVYGAVAYRTSKRTREIGLRIALGAAPAGILSLVLGDGLRVAVLGVIIGLPAALWSTHLLRPMLVAVHPWDITAFAIATIVLTAAVTIATFIPAWRATHVSPATALRSE